MRPLSAGSVVEAWERGQRLDDLGRSLAVLAAALPGQGPAELASLTLGQRDSTLLELRRRTFGERLDGSARCPECGASLEFSVGLSDLAAAGAAPPGAETSELERSGYRVRFRLPTSADLAAAARADGLESARRLLVERCVLEAHGESGPVAAADLPEPVVVALGEAMESLDPVAELPLAIECAACGHGWTAVLDVGRFLWVELSTLAERLLNEVHTLAAAYGWSEAEILAMSSVRRRYYLDLLPAP